MTNVILGDGITGYVIAACLNYNNEDFIIYGNGKYQPPEILLLKYKNYEELERLFHIFEIPITDENIQEYTTSITVGYTSDNLNDILDIPTDYMIENYLDKQHRHKTSSAMSDSNFYYRAIDLKKVYKWLVKKYSNKIIYSNIDYETLKNKYTKNTTFYNTIFKTDANNFEPSIEYICMHNNNISHYDYVYDCNKFSRVKRYTKSTTEYISNPGHYDFTIENYYEEPTIYSKCNIKNNITWIDISRKATNTQIKQEDIINYLVKDE